MQTTVALYTIIFMTVFAIVLALLWFRIFFVHQKTLRELYKTQQEAADLKKQVEQLQKALTAQK